MARPAAFVSDREREILAAVARMATSNPFAPDRVEQERRALGGEFVHYAEVWHMDGQIEGLNPNLSKLSRVAEALAETLRGRLADGALASADELTLYEGFVRYLLFYRYSGELTRIIRDRERGRSATRKVGFYPRLAADFAHFFELPNVSFPLPIDPAFVLAWGFQIRRAFHHVFLQIFGSSIAIAELRGAVWRAIFTHDVERYRRALYERMADIPALVLGESGTGKELVARAIGLSRFIPFDAETGRFVADYAEGYQAVNLAALSSSLIESELFGHRRGAFTGATQDHRGWLEGCGRFGTIFLDEIGDLDPAIQVKLLRVLQSRSFQRIGETEERRFEGKIVAATNRDLEGEIARGRFREDLYYRLCANVIRMPTLREQIADEARGGGGPEELESLIGVIAIRIAGDEGEGLAREVVDWIRAELPTDYDWPGNVRELEQCVRSILVQGTYLPPRRSGANDTGSPASPRGDGSGIAPSILAGEASADALLREYATRVYARCGSYEAAARVLGLDRRTVKAKIDSELLAALRDEPA